MRRLARFLLALLSAGALIPSLIILVMGATYLWQLVQYATAPGGSISLRYKTEDGDALVRVSSYSIDLIERRAVLLGVEVTDPRGRELASLNKVEAWTKGPAIQVRGDELRLKVDRLASGDLDLRGLLPKTEEGGEFGLRLTLRRGVVDYRDQVVGVRKTVLLEGLEAELGDADLIARAKVSLQGLAPTSLLVHSSREGRSQVVAEVPQVEAAPLLDLVRSWLPKDVVEPWKNLSASRLTGGGKLVFRSEGKKAPYLGADFDFEGEGVTLPGAFKGWTGEAQGRFEDGIVRFTGEVVRGSSVVQADGGLSLFPLELGAKLKARSGSPSELWPELRQFVPQGAAYRGAAFEGVARLDKKTWVGGKVAALEGGYGGDKGRSVLGDLAFDGERLALVLKDSQIYARKASGWLDWTLGSGALTGWVSSPEGPLEGIVARGGQKGIAGKGVLTAALTGTASKPLVHAQASVEGTWQFDPKERPIRVSQGEIRGEITAGGVRLDRGVFLTRRGIFSIQGAVPFKGPLALDIEGSGIRLASFVPDLEGTGFLKGAVTGTLGSPKFKGDAEVYSLGYAGREVTWVKGGVAWTPEKASVTDLRGQIGGGSFSGGASVALKSGELQGAFEASNLLLSNWTTPDILGAVDLRSGKISGTLEKPEVIAMARGQRTIAYGIKADSLEGLLTFRDGKAGIKEVALRSGGGLIKGEATYALETEEVQGKFEVENFPLSRLPLPADLALLGGVGQAEAIISGKGLDGIKAEISTRLEGLEVNGEPIGSGGVAVTFEKGEIKADGAVGSVEAFITLESLVANLEAKTIRGQADVLNFDLESLIKMARNSWADQPIAVQDAIRTVGGDVSARVAVEGAWDSPSVTLESASATKLTAYGRSAGDIRIAGNRQGKDWNLSQLVWKGEGIDLLARPADPARPLYREGEGLNLFLDSKQFDLSWLSRLSPGAPEVTGSVAFTAMATGPMDSPEVRASLDTSEAVTLRGEDGAKITLLDYLNIPNIEVVDGTFSVTGAAGLRGFAGTLRAQGPLTAFSDDPSGEATASLVLKERDLQNLIGETQGKESPKLEGVLTGRADLKGKLGDWAASAQLKAEGSKGTFPGAQTDLGKFSVTVDLLGQEVSLKGFAEGSRGGRISLEGLRAELPLLYEEGQGFQEILEESRLFGKAVISGLKVQQPLDPTTAPSEATLNGEVSLGGSLLAAQIGGFLRASGASVSLPGAFQEGGAAQPLPVEPEFRAFRLEADPGSTVRFGLGFLEASGQGEISGPLSALNVRMPLAVKRGLLRLPNARIGIQEGGSVDITLQGSSGLPLQILVDMEGQTTLSARRTSDQYETYAVSLEFRGDLLDPDGLNISASSDPADLTSQEILAIIGQRELVEALAASALQGRGASALRDPLYQIGLPSLTDSLTSRLAEALKLDYLSLDYNPFDQAITRFGKDLGSGFSVQGWRQLSEPAFGPTKFDLRLAYRPRLGKTALDRFRLGFGVTQDRPWRFTIDWSRRW